MARRKRKSAKKSPLAYFDWSINPDTIREVFAVLLMLAGLVSLLAIFSAAGAVGRNVTDLFAALVGTVHYLVPVIILALGILLWDPSRFSVRWTLVIGIGALLLVLPGLLEPFGGVIGSGVHAVAAKLFGEVAGTLVLFVLVIVSLLLAFDMSIRRLLQLLFTAKGDEPQIHDSGAGHPDRISVFELLRQKLTGGGQRVNVSELPAAAGGASVGKPVTGLPIGNWEFPPLDLLNLPTGKATAGNVVKNVEMIEKTLKNFGIDVTMGDVNIGPTVTQYTLKPTEGVKLTTITARSNDLALALAAPSIRIEAPIPGKPAVGIEVPNKVPAIVTLREVIETEAFKETKSNLTLAKI